MTAAMELAVFAGVMALGQFSPGPDMILLTRTALHGGRRDGLAMAAGIASGLLVHATVAVAGMTALWRAYPGMRPALQWLAAAYLLWIAYGLLRERFVAWYSGTREAVSLPAGPRSPYLRGLLCNLLNPKAALFLAAVSSTFLAGERPGWWPLALGGIIVGSGLGLWSLWVLVLQWPPLRAGYQRAAGWIDTAFALFLIGLALGLAGVW